ncbi:MAG: hypothetical protein QM661_03990 [Solimonas sp.]
MTRAAVSAWVLSVLAMAVPSAVLTAVLAVDQMTQTADISGSNLVLHGGGERPAFLDAASVDKA